ncbi:hypothetical protein [Lysinibacillus fusiformis]|uniref:hypothetical protein n=1 Tax=Lysinibacillus fusiformis TaxID=28031 RepID=UPI0004681AE8|nr:hypothetical protein [Lysinibacillus fusiformis]
MLLKTPTIGFNFNDIHKFTTNKKFTSSEINFAYDTEAISLNILSDDLGKRFLKDSQDKLGILSDVPTENNDTKTRQIVRVMKAIKMNIEILNGKEQLIQNGSGYKLAQTKPVLSRFQLIIMMLKHLNLLNGNELKMFKKVLLVL